MGDTDIVTLGKDFNIACDIATKLGYEFGLESTDHSIDLHLPNDPAGTVDVHKYIDFETEYDKKFMKEIFQRGSIKQVFGVQAIIPCAEDMVFIGLCNLSKNLHNKTSMHGILFMLFDCKYLVSTKKDFDWNIIVKNAIKTNTSVSIFFAMSFLNRLVPNILPQELLESKALEKSLTEYCNKVIYYRFYVHEIKMRCKKLKIKNALTNCTTFKQYVKDKPRHFVLKRIKKSPKAIELFLKIFNR